MARRSGFVSALNQMARAAAKAQKERERQERQEFQRRERLQRQYERDQKKYLRELEKEEKQLAKLEKAMYLEERLQETEDLNEGVQEILNDFGDILVKTLKTDDTIQFTSLYKRDAYPEFIPPAPSQLPDNPYPNRDNFFMNTPVTITERLFGIGKKARQEAEQKSEQEYLAAKAEYERLQSVIYSIQKADEEKVAEALQEYEQRKEAFMIEQQEFNRRIDLFRDEYLSHKQDPVEAYNAMVLERSEYDSSFPQQFDLFYNSDSKELVVQYELPSISVVPTFKEYKYVKTKDDIKGSEFKAKERNEIYTTVVSSVALRTLHELFEADQADAIDSIVFNGFVRTTDARTGLDIEPCIITVQARKSEFTKFDLSRVNVIECVKGLRAQVSPSISELAPVKPIVNFDMLDRRFVDERDVLSTLDDRMNLLEMDPFEFEHLICNLFSKIGLESKLTRSSRDGGVDVIAFDPKPIFGGKYVIQAKRYRNTVEVAAVRDLYGTMMNENASKGILVTTSSYGPDARSFAKDKPIELIDGSHLLYMLEEQGVAAKIVVPE